MFESDNNKPLTVSDYRKVHAKRESAYKFIVPNQSIYYHDGKSMNKIIESPLKLVGYSSNVITSTFTLD